MNSSGTYFYNNQCYDENSPGVLAAAILMAVFYSATALTNIVLRIVRVFGGRKVAISTTSLSLLDDFDEKKQSASAASNVVDFQRYKSFRSRRD
jgi:hypothetical protein